MSRRRLEAVPWIVVRMACHKHEPDTAVAQNARALLDETASDTLPLGIGHHGQGAEEHSRYLRRRALNGHGREENVAYRALVHPGKQREQRLSAWVLQEVAHQVGLVALAERGALDGQYILKIGVRSLTDSHVPPVVRFRRHAPDLADLAASHGFGLTRNHPFLDGNKRIGFVTANDFLLLKGHEIDAPEPQVADINVRVSEGYLAEREFAAWMRSVLRPLDPWLPECSILDIPDDHLLDERGDVK